MADEQSLADIEDLIYASATAVAPEHADTLGRLVRDEKISLRLVHNVHDLVFRIVSHVEKQEKQIQVGSRGLLRLWAHVYAYCALYRNAVQESTSYALDFSTNPEMRRAITSLEWALEDQRSAITGGLWLPLPSDAPRPTRHGLSLERIATEVFLVVTAFFIHHELAHARPPLSLAPSDHAQEFGADLAAAKWLLANAAKTPVSGISEYDKRALGAVTGLAWLWVLHLNGLIPAWSATHPPAPLRLEALAFSFLGDSPAVEGVWAWLALLMSWHAQAIGIPESIGAHVKPQDAVRRYVRVALDVGGTAPGSENLGDTRNLVAHMPLLPANVVERRRPADTVFAAEVERIAKRLREGRLSREAVEIAARCGHLAACKVLTIPPPDLSTPASLDRLVQWLFERGREHGVRALVACARAITNENVSAGPELAAISAIDSWLLARTSDSTRRACEAGYESYVAFLRQAGNSLDEIPLAFCGLTALLVDDVDGRLRSLRQIAGAGGVVEEKRLAELTPESPLHLALDYLRWNKETRGVELLASRIRTEVAGHALSVTN